MRLELKNLIQLEQTGDFIWITDKTGLYHAITNPSGWGGPNVNLYQSALLVVGKRIEDHLTFASGQILYPYNYLNDQEVTWKLNYKKDGWNRFWMLRLWVSNNGITDITGSQVFSPGDFFYIPTNPGKIWMKAGSGSSAFIQITDFDNLLDSPDVANAQVFSEILMYTQLLKKKNQIYQQVIDARQYPDLEDEIHQRYQQVEDITNRINAAQHAFDNELKSQANTFIEEIMADYGV